ncbi:MAG: V-type ATP synthase subunit D [Desulfurococcaceae archaeon]|uniref:V-type ATP synthase subunit D n=1 Tax=Staphylothermus marinus TaxID=2280 RepID=A0A7C4JNP6_STAMA
MSTEAIKLPRVTKIELIRLRRRLALTRRLHRILKDRMTLLIQEFYITLKHVLELRQKLNNLLSEIYTQYYRVLRLYGRESLLLSSSTVETNNVLFGTRTVMGIAVPLIEVEEVSKPSIIMPLETINIQLKKKELFETLIELAEYEKALNLIGREVARLRRRVQMLEKILIPRLMNTIRYLTMKFDEIEREEKVRSIKIKAILSARESLQ